MNPSTWAVALKGDQADLDLWKDELSPASDPSVGVIDHPISETGSSKTSVLRSADFADCSAAKEVASIADSLLKRLNGLMAIEHDTRPIKRSHIVEERPDGTFLNHRILSADSGEYVMRGAGVSFAESATGSQLSFPQRVLKTSPTGDLLAAIERFGDADDWPRLFIAYEAIEKHIAPNIKDLKQRRQEVSNKVGFDVSDLVASMNIPRHHGPRAQPTRNYTFEEGRRLLAKIIRACLS